MMEVSLKMLMLYCYESRGSMLYIEIIVTYAILYVPCEQLVSQLTLIVQLRPMSVLALKR